MYNTTGNPKPMGKCPKCGYETFTSLFHICSTAPKISEVFGFKIREADWLAPNQWGFLNEVANEITSEDRKRVYEEVFKTSK